MKQHDPETARRASRGPVSRLTRGGRTVNPARRDLLAAVAALAALAQAPPPDAPPPRIIAVFGDSQAEGLAVALRRVVRQTPGIKVQNHTKAGTAISQPENYDWPAAIRAWAPDPQVDTAVLMFGGNDRLPMRPAPGHRHPVSQRDVESDLSQPHGRHPA